MYDTALYDLFHQPFGLLRIGEWLRLSGYHVDLLDCLEPRARTAAPGRGKFLRQVVELPECLRGAGRRFARYGSPADDLRTKMRAARPDLVMVTTGMTYWYPGVREIGRISREALPGVPVFAGGIYASLLPEHCAGVLGTDLVIGGSAATGQGAGLAAALGKALESAGFPVPAGPIPYQPSVELRAGSLRLCEAAAIRLHEGCSHRCAYCASPVLAPRFVAGNAASLLQHVRRLNARYGMTTFAFYDDALLHDSHRALEPFLEGVIRQFGPRQLRFYLPNAVHLALLDAGLARLMHRAGFREIRFGLESTDAAFHSELDHKLDLDLVSRTVEILKMSGFAGREITGYIMLGLPGQPFAGVRRTLDRVESLGIGVSVAEYSPVPGSPLFERAAAESGLDLREPLLHNNSAFSTLSGFVTPAELAQAKSRARAVRRAIMT